MSTEEKIAHPLFYFSTLGFSFLPATYTFVTITTNITLAKAQGPIAIVFVLCIIAILKYAHPFFTAKERLSILVIIFSLAFPFVARPTLFQYINKIQVPDNYVRISDEDRTRLPRLGEGFIVNDDLNELEWCYYFLEKNNLWDQNFYSSYLSNYILNTGAPGGAAYGIARGYNLSKLYYDSFRDSPFVGFTSKNDTYFFNINDYFSHNSYFTYNPYIDYWLVIDKGIVQTPEGFWHRC